LLLHITPWLLQRHILCGFDLLFLASAAIMSDSGLISTSRTVYVKPTLTFLSALANPLVSHCVSCACRVPVLPCSFVGNIPFEATEQQVRDILNTVGPLQNLRLVHDSKTGKPKGYGFAEYLDAHTASSAIRNLNNHDLSQQLCGTSPTRQPACSVNAEAVCFLSDVQTDDRCE
jgi:hypothetical protein